VKTTFHFTDFYIDPCAILGSLTEEGQPYNFAKLLFDFLMTQMRECVLCFYEKIDCNCGQGLAKYLNIVMFF